MIGTVDISKRGFTNHEHLDEMQLIHMNGRVYDYNNGRFLSVDPYIQAPSSTQSVNPYTYIFNNPLSGIDPTGYAAECDDNGICNLSNVSMDEVDSVDVNDDGSVTLNTTDGESYNVDSITATNNGKQTTYTFNDAGTGMVGIEVSDIGGENSKKFRLDAFGTKDEPSFTKQGASIAADSLPVVGAGKSFIQMLTGKDLVTGEQLSRLAEGGGIVLGMFGAKGFSKLDDGAALAKAMSKAKLPKRLRNKLKRILNETAAGGMRGISGAYSREEALVLAVKFLGEGFVNVSRPGRGTILKSKDGLKQVRIGVGKNNGVNPVDGQKWSKTSTKANFESKVNATDKGWPNNVHLDIE